MFVVSWLFVIAGLRLVHELSLTLPQKTKKNNTGCSMSSSSWLKSVE
jgi:hypothetical protein